MNATTKKTTTTMKALRETTLARKEIYERMLALAGAGLDGGKEYRTLIARLNSLNVRLVVLGYRG